MTNTLLPTLVASLVLGGFPINGLTAQQHFREDDPRQAARCREAVTLLDADASSKAGVIASLQVLRSCERTAGGALSRVWRARPADPELILHLRATSGDMLDRRIMEAVIGAAGDRSAPSNLRVAALEVLGRYVNPRLSNIEENPHWTHGDHPGMRYGFRARLHVVQRIGVVPLDDADTATILHAIGQIAERGISDEPFGAMAARLMEHLEFVLQRSGGR